MMPFEKPKYNAITADHRIILHFGTHFAESFLRFIPRKIKNYPSHGVDHSLNIIKLINCFLKSWGLSLNRDERFLLYLAAWLHDIGCIKSRSGHGRQSVRIFTKDETLCNYLNDIDTELLVSLKDVVKSHSSSYKLEQVPIRRGKVRVRFICAIFRLMDACEITNFKCPVAVFEEINNTFKKRVRRVTVTDTEAIDFWEGHMNIKDVVFLKPQIEIHINDRHKSKEILDRLKLEIKSIKQIFIDNHIEVPVIKIRLN